ncbi:Bifunctional dihydroflavonol 4-reductase/flavanone 4-reductase [Hordeum vulgare]|nr:Bifunctional dihydroflavonol 4-reductase/flavanone 4-reductase [Hordeum vulgare]
MHGCVLKPSSHHCGPIPHFRLPRPLPVLAAAKEVARCPLWACRAWVAEITDNDTHTKHWLGSFNTVELATCEYGQWQIQLHGAVTRHNFSWGGEMPLFDDQPPQGMVIVAFAREDQQARERIVVKATDEDYMADLRR